MSFLYITTRCGKQGESAVVAWWWCMVVMHYPQGMIITLGHVDAYRHRLEGLRAVPMTMMT